MPGSVSDPDGLPVYFYHHYKIVFVLCTPSVKIKCILTSINQHRESDITKVAGEDSLD
jgi:hypothetical protein